jgi:RsiW-degrading membrane proteinase PrsW (M82 family)
MAPQPQVPQWPQMPPPGYWHPYGAYPMSPLYYPYAWAGTALMYASYVPGGSYPAHPRPAPGNGYRQFLAWTVTIGAGLIALMGFLFALLFGLEALLGNSSLTLISLIIFFGLVPVVGGAVCVYLGIRSIIQRPSPRFTLPSWWLIALLVVAALGGAIVIWNVSPVPGNVWAMVPLFALGGLLPVATILAFANRRLANPSTWRHVLVSMIYGATVAALLAAILEYVIQAIITIILQALGFQISFNPNLLQTVNPSDPAQVLLLFLLLSAVAPVVEETLKPVAAIFAIPRLRSAGEAFLVGLAAGVGFAFVETLTYFGQGQADWISVAIARLGAGLLHGVGAGMTAMGWYLLLRGTGVPLRWLKGIGAILYAIVQHGLFNAASMLDAVPIVKTLSQTYFYLGRLPFTADLVIYLVLYTLLIALLIVVTGRLRKGVVLADQAGDQTGSAAASVVPVAAQGGAR